VKVALDLSPHSLRVFDALETAGHKVYVVGGAVRDAALGRAIGDIDLATDALPEQVIAASETADLRTVPTGLEHGTVTVLAQGVPHEVTTFRTDVQTDGRHAKVAFGGDVESDAARRDFTMNALYATRDGEVLDPVGGWPDLIAQRVRFVGDAAGRIEEDALRILRFFRFHAWYGADDVDAEALAAIADGLDGLRHVSSERVVQEMRKLLAAPDPAPAVAAMAACGVLMQVLPGADTHALAPLVHVEGTREIRFLRRLSVLGGETQGLRLSNKERRALARIAEAQGYGIAEAAWRLGPEAAEDAALVIAASTGGALPDDLDAAIARGVSAKFPLNGDDLLEHMEPGRRVGTALRKAESLWIASGFTLSKEKLIEALEIG